MPVRSWGRARSQRRSLPFCYGRMTPPTSGERSYCAANAKRPHPRAPAAVSPAARSKFVPTLTDVHVHDLGPGGQTRTCARPVISRMLATELLQKKTSGLEGRTRTPGPSGMKPGSFCRWKLLPSLHPRPRKEDVDRRRWPVVKPDLLRVDGRELRAGNGRERRLGVRFFGGAVQF